MKFLFIVFCGFFTLSQINQKSLSEVKVDSIITIFCMENVKAEILKANLKYDESVGKEICNCYIENLANNLSHNESISQCKQESKKKFNL
tara:strand:+ start:1649 stop:1918 length:270 start_codon:yes stop_codon:yes gene_type:complete